MSLQPELSDSALWEAVRAGDAEAFTGMIKRYSRFLIGYGRKLTNDKELVKDCIQDLFADIWLYRSNLSPSASVHTYLLVSLRRKIHRSTRANDYIQFKESEADDYPFMVTFSIQDQWLQSETEQQQLLQLNHVINALPERQKEVLYLKFYQNLDHYEIAELLDMQYQSVSNLVQRALAHLRKNWREEFTSLLFFVLSADFL